MITDRHQLQPPNSDTGDGRIECTVSSGQARFTYHGQASNNAYNVPNAGSQRATAVIPAGDFSNFVNIEGSCGGIYHYLFLSNGEMCVIQEQMQLRFQWQYVHFNTALSKADSLIHII